MAEVASELKGFLKDATYYLDYTIANLGNLFPNKKEYLKEVGSLINDTWNKEIRPKFDDSTKKIDEIKRCNALIAIATPRHLDALRGLWRTLE